MGGSLANVLWRANTIREQQTGMAVFGPEHAQCAASEIGQGNEAIFVALTTADMHPLGFSIDIADLKGQGLAETQAHGIGGEEKDPVA